MLLEQVCKHMSALKRKYFGTDGIRGKVGEAPITPDFVLKLGWAVGCIFAREGYQNNKVLIGKDTRISGYMFESALEAGLSAAGIDIHLLGPMPTPAIAYLTRALRAQAGIVISASHNPYYDNGIKFFSAEGTKLPDAVELAIEEQLDQPMVITDSTRLGKAVRVTEARGRYIEFCKNSVPAHLNLKGMKIIVDCANGATYHSAPNVFRELGAEVIELAVEPDGLNINANCGSTHPEIIRKIVLAENADLGIAFDGDGDRLLMIDSLGEIIDGDELLFIMAKEGLRSGRLKGGVVGTLMSNLGLELALKELGLEFFRAQVGDRYVMEELQRLGWQLGGETSGHILCLHSTTTGDGIIAALQILAAMKENNSDLHQLKQGMKKFPQVMLNVKLANKNKLSLEEPSLQAAVQQAETKLGNCGRVLLRSSGTEPVVRVMVEGENLVQVKAIANDLAATVQAAVA
jgi:phosphoglucosamine mutase